MSDDHREMAHALRGVQTRVNECAALPVHAAQLLQTSSDVHRALLARDAQWLTHVQAHSGLLGH